MFDIINPRQSVLITTRGKISLLGKEDIKDNISVVEWHMPCSYEPMHYAVALNKNKLSLKLIRESGFFVVNFMPYNKSNDIAVIGKHSGEVVDKFSLAMLNKDEADTIDCPIIKQACATIECEVINEIDSGDHVIIIAKASHTRMINKEKRAFHVKGDVFTTTVD